MKSSVLDQYEKELPMELFFSFIGAITFFEKTKVLAKAKKISYIRAFIHPYIETTTIQDIVVVSYLIFVRTRFGIMKIEVLEEKFHSLHKGDEVSVEYQKSWINNAVKGVITS